MSALTLARDTLYPIAAKTLAIKAAALEPASVPSGDTTPLAKSSPQIVQAVVSQNSVVLYPGFWGLLDIITIYYYY